MAQSDVATLISLITSYSLPADPSGLTLYTVAVSQLAIDAPGMDSTLALTYFIAHLLDGGADGAGITSEKLDDYSVTYADNGNTSPYYMMYLKTIESYKKGTLKNMSLDGVAHQDSESMYIFGVYTDV